MGVGRQTATRFRDVNTDRRPWRSSSRRGVRCQETRSHRTPPSKRHGKAPRRPFCRPPEKEISRPGVSVRSSKGSESRFSRRVSCLLSPSNTTFAYYLPMLLEIRIESIYKSPRFIRVRARIRTYVDTYREFMIFFITLCIFINWGCATIYAQRERDRTLNVRY